MLPVVSKPHLDVPSSAVHSRPAWRGIDTWSLGVLALLTALHAGVIHASLDPRFLSAPTGNDVWFEADMPAVADGMVHRWADHVRNAHHPLFALWTTLPSYGLSAVGLDRRQRIMTTVVCAAAVWGALVFLLVRWTTPTRFDAVLFTLLVYASAASVFWLPTAETYVLGSATLLAPLVLGVWESGRRFPDWWYVVASALSLSVTITNWMSGVAATFSARNIRAALRITASALTIVVVLWTIQKLIFPSVPFFVGSDSGGRFFWPEMAGGPVAVTRSLIFHSVVMPDLQVVLEPKWGARLSVQGAALGSSGAVGGAATLLWATLLTGGIASLWAATTNRSIRRFVLPTLVGQLVLYNCYGEESFLYALHLAPLLVVCAAAGTTTTFRRWFLLGAGILIVLLVINNFTTLDEARQFFSWGGRTPPPGP